MYSNSSIIHIPLVRANAFIGLDQYHERTKTILKEAIKVVRKRCFDSDASTDDDRPNCVPPKRRHVETPLKSTGNPTKPMKTSAALVQSKVSIGLDKLSRKRKPSDEFDMVDRPEQQKKLRLNIINSTPRCEKDLLLKSNRKRVDERDLLNKTIPPKYYSPKMQRLNIKKYRAIYEEDTSNANGELPSLVRTNSMIGSNLLTENGLQSNNQTNDSSGGDSVQRRKQRLSVTDNRKSETIGIDTPVKSYRKLVDKRDQLNSAARIDNSLPKNQIPKSGETSTTANGHSTLTRCKSVIGSPRSEKDLLLQKNRKRVDERDLLNKTIPPKYYSPKMQRLNTQTYRSMDEEDPLNANGELPSLVRTKSMIGANLLTKNCLKLSNHTNESSGGDGLQKMKQRLSVTDNCKIATIGMDTPVKSICKMVDKRDLLNSAARIDNSLPKNQMPKSRETSTTANGHSSLTRCKSVIGSQLLTGEKSDKNMQSDKKSSMENKAAIRINNSHTRRQRPKVSKENENSSSGLVRCNAVIGMELLTYTDNNSEYSSDIATERELTKVATERDLTKEEQYRLKIFKMERAVREWNAYFGSHYKLRK